MTALFDLPFAVPRPAGSASLKRKRQGFRDSPPSNFQTTGVPRPPTGQKAQPPLDSDDDDDDNNTTTATQTTHGHRSSDGEAETETDADADADAEAEAESRGETQEQGEQVGLALTKSGIAQRNVKRQHFAVLTALLHTSLLQQDFTRASRAYGMLLRVDLAGIRMDIRKKGLWCVGAEILLQRDKQDVDASLQESGLAVMRDGYDATKAFYDRLILQYPFKSKSKSHSHSADATHFHSATLGLWIMQIQERARFARANINADADADLDYDNADAMSLDPYSSTLRQYNSPSPDPDRLRLLQEVAAEELRQAQAVATRIEDLTSRPPLDQDHRMLALRAMVELWLADLCADREETADEAEDHREASRNCVLRLQDRGAPVPSTFDGMEDFV